MSFALDVPPKWVDNVLAHHSLRGVVRGGRGISRRIAQETVVELAVGLTLARELEMPIARALELAREATAPGHAEPLRVGDVAALHLDLPAVRRRVDERLRLAAELLPASRRGRPPGRRAYS